MFLDFSVDLDNAYLDLKNLIKNNKNEIDRLLGIKDKTYKNFIKKFQDITDKVDMFITSISHIDSVLNSEKSSSVYESLLPLLSDYTDEISQNIKIYNAFVEIRKNENSSLSDSQKMLLDNEIRDFLLQGAKLSLEKKERLKKINLNLKQLSKKFSKNILDEIREYELILDNYDDVKDIPENDLKNAKITVDGKIKYKFTMQAPSYISYMTYGSNRKIREKLYKRYVTLGLNNGEIIDNILRLRDKKAKLLGFDNYCDLSISFKSAKSKEVVIKFLYDIADKTVNKAKQELNDLQKFANKKIEAYDFYYYSQLYKKEILDVDMDRYRPYFQKSAVVDSLISFVSEMFNLQYKKIEKVAVWHKDVIVYEFLKNNKVISRLYLDLESRDNKKSGAWMNNWQTTHIDSGGKKHQASAFIVCNFQPSNDGVSLLRHSDVVTLFHEMGHAIHHMFSKCDDIFVSGVNGVLWDVVEFPSQFLENFAFNKRVLKKIGVHYQTGKIISDKMIDKLISIKNFQSSYNMIRQLEFSIFDIKLHQKLYQKDEVQRLLDKIRDEISPILPPKYNKFQHSFSHIFAGGYASGYYSYKWAEVMSADLYLEVIKDNKIDIDIMNKYYNSVLSMGGSKDMGDMFFDILNREPKIDSLILLNEIKEKNEKK